MDFNKCLISVSESDTCFIDQKLCLYHYIIDKLILFKEVTNRINVISNKVGISVVCW